MLEAEGFRRNALIDIFDGGPVVECETSKIRAVAQSTIANWEHCETPGEHKALVARFARPFMVIETNVAFDYRESGPCVGLCKTSSELLGLVSDEKTVVLILEQKRNNRLN
jgi:arginine N-succinyltransferase